MHYSLSANVPGKDKTLKKDDFIKNHLFTKNLIKNSNTKFIFLSSTKVYNKSARIGYPFPIKIDKISDYNSSKIFSENLIIKKCKDYLILRVPSVIGPDVKNGLLYKIIKKKFFLKTVPNNIWCLIYVNHLNKPIEYFLNNKIKKCILNIGYDFDYSFSKVLNYTYKNLNKKIYLNKSKEFKLFLDKKFRPDKNTFFKDLRKYINLIK